MGIDSKQRVWARSQPTPRISGSFLIKPQIFPNTASKPIPLGRQSPYIYQQPLWRQEPVSISRSMPAAQPSACELLISASFLHEDFCQALSLTKEPRGDRDLHGWQQEGDVWRAHQERGHLHKSLLPGLRAPSCLLQHPSHPTALVLGERQQESRGRSRAAVR